MSSKLTKEELELLGKYIKIPKIELDSKDLDAAPTLVKVEKPKVEKPIVVKEDKPNTPIIQKGKKPNVTDIKLKVYWEALSRATKQLSGGRSNDWKRGAIPVKKELEEYLKKKGIIK